MILDPEKSYTFSEIFELNAPTIDILAELGYAYRTQKLDLRRYPVDTNIHSLYQLACMI